MDIPFRKISWEGIRWSSSTAFKFLDCVYNQAIDTGNVRSGLLLCDCCKQLEDQGEGAAEDLTVALDTFAALLF